MPISRAPADWARVPRRAPRVLELRALPEAAVEARSSIESPCVRVCCLDDNDMCLGCGRMLIEIREWRQCDDVQRQRILEAARARLAR